MFDALTVLIFACALMGPLLDVYVFRPKLDRSVQAEYRMPAPQPKRPKTLRALGSYPSRFGAWYRDTFGLRDYLLKLHAQLMWRGFGLSPTDVVVRGKDSVRGESNQPWIFFDEDRALETQRGDAPFTEQDLAGWLRMFESRRDWCAERSIDYVSVVVPNKAEIYPEFLPDGNAEGESRLDQLRDYMTAHSDVRFVDLKAALIEAKASDRPQVGDFLYRPLGTHWTDRGAYAGLKAVLSALEPLPAGVEARPIDALELRLGRPDAGDFWGSRLYLGGLSNQEEWVLHDSSRDLEIKNGPKGSRAVFIDRLGAKTKARIFVLHDSFGTQIRDLLAERFAASKFVWDYRFDPEAIESFGPDIFVDLRVERALVFQAPELAPGVEVESLPERFESSSRLLWRSEGTRGLRIWKRGSLEEGADRGFLLDAMGAGTGVLLPEIDVPEGCNLAIRVEYESPEAGGAYLVYRTERDPFMNPRKALKASVKRGPNVLHFEVLSSRLDGRSLLRLLDKKGRVHVRSIEARALPLAD